MAMICITFLVALAVLTGCSNEPPGCRGLVGRMNTIELPASHS